MADVLSLELREGRLVKVIPSKGLIILTADAEPQEVAEALLRAKGSIGPYGSAVPGSMPEIGASAISYGLFSLDGQSHIAAPAYSIDLPPAGLTDAAGQVEM